jgi:hypothetical protein
MILTIEVTAVSSRPAPDDLENQASPSAAASDTAEAPDAPSGAAAWRLLLVVVLILIAISGALLVRELVPTRGAEAVSLVGDVQVQRRASSSPQPLEVGDVVRVGSILQAAEGASATLHFGHPSTWRTESAGKWRLLNVRHSRDGAFGRAVIQQYAGQASYVSPLPKDNLDILVQVEVDGATITLQGAATLTTTGDTTAVHLLSGTAVLLTPSEYLVVPEGGTAFITPGQPVEWTTPLPTAVP